MRKRELTLEELRQRELALLREFKTFCRDRGLTWFLSNGSLLGAVKYGDYIPWDDDIDVLMPRADYDRFVKTWVDFRQVRLFCPERDRDYRYPFAKLCDMDTVKEEENVDNGVTLGVDMDIFPLDAWGPEPEAQADRMGRWIRHLTAWKCVRAMSRNPLKRLVKNMLLPVGRKLTRLLVDRMGLDARKNARMPEPAFLGCVVWCIYGHREILPAAVFRDTVSVRFAGEAYPAPVGYEEYLRSLYGDYTLDPPPDARKTHHRFRAYVWEEAE